MRGRPGGCEALSAGAFFTVSGTLSEQTSHGHHRIDRTLIAGKGRSFAPGHVHVSNVGLLMALPVHLNTSPYELDGMTVTPARLQVHAVSRVGVVW